MAQTPGREEPLHYSRREVLVKPFVSRHDETDVLRFGTSLSSARPTQGHAHPFALSMPKLSTPSACTTVAAAALSWTTGTVTVTATGGPIHTIIARHGFDNRDGYGYGDIQMVAPMLTRWVFAEGAYYSGSIGFLRIQVAPEPHEWVLLGAGISMLGLLYRANRGSRNTVE